MLCCAVLKCAVLCSTVPSMLCCPLSCCAVLCAPRSLLDTNRAFDVGVVVPLAHALLEVVVCAAHDLETQVGCWGR